MHDPRQMAILSSGPAMLLPMLDLPTREGERVRWTSWWQRRPVLVMFPHESCGTCAEALAALHAAKEELAFEDAALLVVESMRSPDALPGTTELLDPDGRLAERLRMRPGMLLAADRYFEIRAAVDVHDLGPTQAVGEALEWLRLAERECPECGVSTWPSGEPRV